MKPSLPITFYAAAAATVLLATPAFAARGHQQPEKQPAPAAAWASSSTEQKFHRAVQAFDRGDYAAALPVLRELAAQDNVKAQTMLGIAYAVGKGVPQDLHQSAVWMEKAAERGYAPAQSILGSAYAEGKGVAQNDQTAFFWLEKAAEQGDAGAQFDVGVAYRRGLLGVKQDSGRARFWLEKSAAQGDADAQRVLQEMSRTN